MCGVVRNGRDGVGRQPWNLPLEDSVGEIHAVSYPQDGTVHQTPKGSSVGREPLLVTLSTLAPGCPPSPAIPSP